MIKKIKICGIKDSKNISVCNEIGIDFIGFNFADVSPRKIKPSYAKKNNLSSYCDKVERVAVFVDPADVYIDESIKSINATYIQLHGNESTKRCFDIKNLLVTRSDKGMTLVNRTQSIHLESKAKQVYDISGAGDTVIASLCYGLSKLKLDLEESMIFANKAASIVIGKFGTSTITLEELQSI